MENERVRMYLAAVLVGVLTFIVYLPALNNQFIKGWDDGAYVTENRSIRSMDANLLRDAFLRFHASNWHPVTIISHALDYAVWGLDPAGHHLTSILLHALNTFLVVLLAARLLAMTAAGRPAGEQGHGGRDEVPPLVAGTVTGLLFGLHPVHVESVAWVAERKDLLCALFCLLSLHAYLGHVRMRMHTGPDSATSAGIFPDRRLMTSLLLFGLALMSKPMAVSLPVLFLIIDWYVSGRVTVPMLTGKIPFFVLSALDAGLTMYAQQEGRSVVSLVDLPLSTRLLVAARSVIGYIGNLAWPAELLPLYPYPLQPRLLSPRFFLPVAAVTAFTCACVAGVVKNRAVSALWCSFLVMLLPVIGIVQVGGQAMADRYLYLPGIPPFLGVGACAALLLANTERYRLPAGIARPSLFLLAALVCGVLAYATVKQVRLWRDGVTLWTFAVDRIAHLDPSEFLYNLVYHNRGIEYEVAGRLEEAERDFRTAIALHPSYANSHYSLAVVLFKQGRLDEAALSFEASAYFNPVDADAQYNRGVIYLQQGRTEEAVGALRKAEQLRPSDIDTLYTLGKAYFLLGRSAEAEQKLQAVISRQYTIKEAHLLLGDLYAQRGDRQRAIREYEATLMLNPRSDEVRRKLDALLAAPHASQRQ